MHLKKVILGLILSMSFVQTWADEPTTQATTDTQSTEMAVPTKPAVILPQDEDEIDAAPDDNEFEVTPEK